MTEKVRLKSGKTSYANCELTYEDNKVIIKAPYNANLLAEIKALQGRKFDWDTKCWIAPLTIRNLTALDYLREDRPNPFEKFNNELIDFKPNRSELFEYQREMLNFLMTRRTGVLAAEMGTGKSLVLIEAMELSGLKDDEIWYVSTCGGVVAFKLEMKKWNCKVSPKLFNFEKLKLLVNDTEFWETHELPKMLIGDESSRLKSPKAQRTVAFQNLANAMRDAYPNCYVLEATGSPAPKSPVDWWSQCEIAFPGFIKEGSQEQFKDSLCLTVFEENEIGQKYPKIITWWDNPEKCKECGEVSDHSNHPRQHIFEPSVNKVAGLNKKLSNKIAKIVLKNDVLSFLPDKHYRIIECEPSEELLRTARIVADSCMTAAEALIKLRALSDGFQYSYEKIGEKPCDICMGGLVEDYVVEDEESYEDIPEFLGEKQLTTCWKCGGTQKTPIFKRQYLEIECPKFDALANILEDHADDGRLVIFASFHASLDKLEKFLLDKNWSVITVDGRGWRYRQPNSSGVYENNGKINNPETYVEKFQAGDGKIVFLAHPKSGGMSLTLTASSEIVYFSNPFDGEDRIQSEDRIHRPSMDLNKGATISDLFNLPTGKYVFNNLKNKKFLQAITMNDVKKILELKNAD